MMKQVRQPMLVSGIACQRWFSEERNFSGVYQTLRPSYSGLARVGGKEQLWDPDIKAKTVKTASRSC